MERTHQRTRLITGAPRSAGIAMLLAVLLFAGGYATGRGGAADSGARAGPLQEIAKPLPGGIGLVTPEQVLAADPSTYLLVDVRGRDAFDFAHAAGAISMPESEMIAVAPTLPADRTLVIYCTCPADETSLRAARTLVGVFHVPNVVVLHTGLLGLKDAGGAMSSDETSSAIEHKGCGCDSNAEAFKLWAIDRATQPGEEALTTKTINPFR